MYIASRSTDYLPKYKDLEENGFSRDRKLLDAARYYTIKYRPEAGGARAARVRYPNVYRASLIFKGESYFGYWKQLIEAMLLTNLTLKEIAEKLGVGEDLELIKTYRDLFFDTASYKNQEACIQMNIISVACRGDGLEPTEDYLSKLTAYQKGYDTFYRLFVGRESSQFTDEDANWIQNLMKSKLSMKALNLASSTRTSYLNENLEILKTGRDWLVNDSVDTDALGSKAKSEALTELLSTVHQVCDEVSEGADQLTSEEYEEFAEVDWSSGSEESGNQD